MQSMEHDIPLREQLARRGIESCTDKQKRSDFKRLQRVLARMAQPETSVPGLEVVYIEAEYIESAPAPLE